MPLRSEEVRTGGGCNEFWGRGAPHFGGRARSLVRHSCLSLGADRSAAVAWKLGGVHARAYGGETEGADPLACRVHCSHLQFTLCCPICGNGNGHLSLSGLA